MCAIIGLYDAQDGKERGGYIIKKKGTVLLINSVSRVIVA